MIVQEMFCCQCRVSGNNCLQQLWDLLLKMFPIFDFVPWAESMRKYLGIPFETSVETIMLNKNSFENSGWTSC